MRAPLLSESTCRKRYIEGFLERCGSSLTRHEGDSSLDPDALKDPFPNGIPDSDPIAQAVDRYKFETRIAYYDALTPEIKEQYLTLADQYRGYAWNPPVISG